MIFSCKAINNLYGCGKSTIRKYTLIVCRVLSSRNRLFGTYIHAPRGHILMDTIRKFRDLTGLPNVVGAIDGTYILLSTGPQRVLILMLCDFFNRKNFHSVLLQATCVVEGFFWECVCKTTSWSTWCCSVFLAKNLYRIEDTRDFSRAIFGDWWTRSWTVFVWRFNLPYLRFSSLVLKIPGFKIKEDLMSP